MHNGVVGKEATKLYDDANALLDKIIKEKWLNAKGVVGFFLLLLIQDILIHSMQIQLQLYIQLLSFFDYPMYLFSLSYLPNLTSKGRQFRV